MKKFEGKKLLLLGTSAGSVEMVNYAKSEGAYVIVTDYLPTEKSAAKQCADQQEMISTTDIEALCNLAKKENIDGVFCGVSEMNLLSVRKIATELNLYCYFTDEQWELCQNKEKFKKLCNQFGVPTPKDYSFAISNGEIDMKSIEFPIIVKPVDSCAGKGITICYDETQLSKAFQYALSCSESKTVLIEEYVVGDEFSVTYTIKDSQVSVSCSKDKLFTEDYHPVFSQFDVFIMPSKHLESYMKNIHKNVEKLFEHIGTEYGSVTLQGVVKNGEFKFFEMCYRINGGSDYRHIEKENGINYLHMMVDYALTGKADDFDLSKDNPFFSKHFLTFIVYAHAGVIGRLEGIETVKKLPGVISAEWLRDVGDEIIDNKTLMQRVFRAYIANSDIESIKETIKEIQRSLKIEDVDGNDMRYKPFNVERLNGYGEDK